MTRHSNNKKYSNYTVKEMLQQSQQPQQQQGSSSRKVALRTYAKDPWCDENVQQFVDAWQLTPEQVSKLWKLQQKLVDVDHFKNEPEAVLRFMFAPHGYDAAETNFRKMVQWRLDNNIDTLLEDYTPPTKLLENASAAMLHGFDRDGDPIYVERGGATDAGALLREFGHDELVTYALWTRELHTRGAWIDRFERLQGRRIKGVTVVYDLKGLSSKHMNPKVLDLFGDIMKVSHDNYPGPIKRMIIIRAPSIFRYIWAVAKHFFRQSARNKMIFASKNYLEVLDKYIDRRVLPPSIAPGGCGQVAIGQPPLIGDIMEEDCETTSKVQYHNKRHSSWLSVDTSYGSLPSATSLGDSDDGSSTLSSSDDELSSSSPFEGSVSGSALFKGHWEECGSGGSEVFTSPFGDDDGDHGPF